MSKGKAILISGATAVGKTLLAQVLRCGPFRRQDVVEIHDGMTAALLVDARDAIEAGKIVIVTALPEHAAKWRELLKVEAEIWVMGSLGEMIGGGLAAKAKEGKA